jgi:cytochrome c-type biogenesis protein CcmH
VRVWTAIVTRSVPLNFHETTDRQGDAMSHSSVRQVQSIIAALTVFAVVVLAAAAPRSEAASPSLKVAVSLSPALAGKAGANDVVFIFARAVQGPRMPLAVVRKQVKDLPTTVVLDDSNAMSPMMKLSGAPEVIVVARVSKSGMTGAQPGDLEGETGPVKPGGQAIAVSIARVVAGR